MKADAIATRMSVLTRALPMRVLLVDDDELELELMADRIASAGFEVRQATNGEEALRLLEQQWYPIIITDWQMPVMDGLTFSERLRGRGEVRSVSARWMRCGRRRRNRRWRIPTGQWAPRSRSIPRP